MTAQRPLGEILIGLLCAGLCIFWGLAVMLEGYQINNFAEFSTGAVLTLISIWKVINDLQYVDLMVHRRPE